MPSSIASLGWNELDAFAVEQNLPAGRLMNTAEDADQRGLPGAVVADQTDQLAGIEVNADVLQSLEVAEEEVDVLHLDQGAVLGRSHDCTPYLCLAATRAQARCSQSPIERLKMTAMIRRMPTKVMYQDDGAPSAISW